MVCPTLGPPNQKLKYMYLFLRHLLPHSLADLKIRCQLSIDLIEYFSSQVNVFFAILPFYDFTILPIILTISSSLRKFAIQYPQIESQALTLHCNLETEIYK